MTDRLFVSVLKSPRKEGMYLFVERGQDLGELPGSMMGYFGKPEPVMDLVLTPERRLARVTASDVMAAINEQGFYIQMPPSEEELAANPFATEEKGQ